MTGAKEGAMKRKKGFISEEDVSFLLQRYNPTTIITLLQEISQVSSPRIDWNALFKRTATGISSARECQMLWRHLAYCDKLLEKVEDGAEPLDDDSDLEFELEAFPLGTGEVLSEAASCVKVLMSSNLTREPGLVNRTTGESPLTTNVANDLSTSAPSEKQQLPHVNRVPNVTVSASTQKRTPATGIFAEGVDGNGPAASCCPPKKKRKIWTKEEDMELFAAVRKFGECNWTVIQKSGLMPDRTASQLSQRWSFHQKKKGPGVSGSKSTYSTPSEERLAMRKAIDMALDDYKTGRLSTRLSGATQPVMKASSIQLSTAKSDALPISAPQLLNQLHQVPTQAKLQKITLNPSNKPQTTSKMQVAPLKAAEGQKNMLKAVALAAGGRLGTPSTAASLFKAAQSKNAVYIGPGGDSKPNFPATNVKPLSTSYTIPQATCARSSRPSASLNTPSLANPVSLPTGLRHGSQQTQVSPGKLADNPSISSRATNQETLMVSISGTASHENADGKTDIVFPALDVDELLAEGSKGLESMEIDVSAIQDSQAGMPGLVVIVSDNTVSGDAHDAQGPVDKQEGFLKTVVNEDQNIDAKVIAHEAESAEGKSMEIDADGDQIAIGDRSRSCNGEPSRCPLLNSVKEQVHMVDEEHLAAKETISDQDKKSCSKEEQHLPSVKNSPGSKLAANA